MKKLNYLIAALGLLLISSVAEAQPSRNPCYTTGATTTQGIFNCIGVGTSTPLPVILGGGSGAAGSTSNASSGVATSSTNIPAVSYGYLWNGLTWDQSTGLLTGVAGAPGADVVTVQSPITLGSAGYPSASTPIAGNASGSTSAVIGTLAGVASKTTYMCDFDVSALGTSGSIGPIVISGLLGGSKTYQIGTLATGTQQLISKNFTPCIPASAVNTAIVITTTADATATAVNVNSSGYQQ